jgi:hypothetical protein
VRFPGICVNSGRAEYERFPVLHYHCAHSSSQRQAHVSTRVRVRAIPGTDVPPSIFGRAVGGLEVIHAIEQAPADKNDRPWDPITMHSLEYS